jgi:lipopolysaccharide/colanic/teichoic acid biosynthesis glycosyltransferase
MHAVPVLAVVGTSSPLVEALYRVLEIHSPEEMYKFACRPGITGLAQINGRELLNFGERLVWDLKYVRTRTVWLDLKIIFTTLKML